MTILDCCISLKMIKKILVVLGVVDMRQLLLKVTCLTHQSTISSGNNLYFHLHEQSIAAGSNVCPALHTIQKSKKRVLGKIHY